MACLVVAIHTTNWSMMGLLDTAVPWFSLASGFFLFRKLKGDKAQDIAAIRTWTGKVIKLYLIWTAIFLPFALVGFYLDQLSFPKAVAIWFRNVILVGENYLSWPLWYLLALIWGGLLIGLMRRAGLPLWGMFLLGLALYIGSQYFRLDDIPAYTRIFKTSRNGLFFGLVFLTGGGLIQKWVSAVKVNRPVLWDILLVTGFFIGLQFSHYFLLPLSASLFLLSLRIDLPGLGDKSAKRMGAISKTVYLAHMIVAGLLILLAGMNKGELLYFLTLAGSMLMALLFSGPWKETKINQLLFQ